MELVTSTNIFFERRFEQPIPLEECLSLCAQSGYRQLDFGFAELALVSRRFHSENWMEELQEYKMLAAQKGLRFVQAHATILDFCNPGENFPIEEELFRRSILGARYLGADWIVVHPATKITGYAVDPCTHSENVRFFKHWAAFAREAGIGLAIENMWGTTREGVARYGVQPEQLLRLVEDIACENVRLCWDVEHGSIEKLDQSAALRLLKPYVVATHISDETGENNIHILPYFGNIDWEALLSVFAEISYEGTFDFEIQHYMPGVPKELALPALKFSHEVGSHLIRRLEQLKARNI